MKISKSDLIDLMARDSGLTKADSNRALDAIIAAITNTLAEGGQVVIPGFGTFLTAKRAARTGRNPQTGAQIMIKASTAARFKAGKSLKEAVQR